MPVPKKRRSIARRKRYVATWKVHPAKNLTCKNCGAPVLPHKVCDSCGFYKGKKVMVTKSEKSAARQARKKEKNKE